MPLETIESFAEQGKQEQSVWRSIVLFGRNVASYKFALAKSLVGLAQGGRDVVTLDELAVPYAEHLCEHLAHSPKQATSPSSRFLDACRAYGEGRIPHDELVATTMQLGFNNVLDAFHVVNQDQVPLRFFEKDFSGREKRLVLTDEVFRLAESPEAANILEETESRWNLVETAWEMGVNANLLAYDEETQRIFADNSHRRKDVTSARGALSGYQKGHCFYCYAAIDISEDDEEETDAKPKLILDEGPSRIDYALISLDEEEETDTASDGKDLCDVDHFLPHMLSRQVRHLNFDGVWNLVLACKECNRGAGGKFARIPDLLYLERLYRRNEYLILSHHPLRESLIAQTGPNPQERWSFLKRADAIAEELLPGVRWRTEQRGEVVF